MILLGYIIIAHPDWSESRIKIFIASRRESDTVKADIEKRIAAGRLPITFTNIEIVTLTQSQTEIDAVERRSKQAGLTLIGFNEEVIDNKSIKFFTAFQSIGDILFVHASQQKEIN